MIWEICREWALCREALIPAIDMTHGTHTEDDVLMQLFLGQLKLWRNKNSGVVTEFNQFPRLKCMNMFLIGGRMEDVMELQPALEKYARENGCQRLTGFAARKGWERVLTECTVAGSVMYKDL